MSETSSPSSLHYLLLLFSGWVNRHQNHVIDYLMEENRILRGQFDARRLRLTDKERRRLAVKGKVLGRKVLGAVAGIVTPDTILRWYRRLVTKKYDGSAGRGRGRPRTKTDIAELVIRMEKENSGWSYTRIRDASRHLGHEIASTGVVSHAPTPFNEGREAAGLGFVVHLGEKVIEVVAQHLRDGTALRVSRSDVVIGQCGREVIDHCRRQSSVRSRLQMQ